MDVIDTTHKEQTKIEISDVENYEAVNLEINAIANNLLSLSMNTKAENIYPVKINSDFDLGSSFQTHQSKILETIVNQKQQLIIDKIKEHIPNFNIETESQRPHKRIQRVLQGNSETYFLNKDASKIRLITFIKEYPKINKSEECYAISVNESYY